MTTLHELVDLRTIVDASVAEMDGELTPETEKLLDGWQVDFEKKVENIALMIEELEDFAAAGRAHVRKVADRSRAAEARAAWLRGYLQKALVALDRPKVRTPVTSVYLSKGKRSVVEVIPFTPADLKALYESDADVFVRRTETYALDKEVILGAASLPAELATRVKIVQPTILNIR